MSPRVTLLLAVYALTGATSLAYQLCWSRLLALAFGGTLLTTSAVVACFLAGLALGSFLLGPLADRLERPLLLYCLLEAGVGVLALLTPGAARWIRVALPAEHGPWLTVAATAAFLLPPTLLMGGTFPALLAAVGRATRRAPTALVYGINTAGAVLGVLGAAFWALPAFGLTRTVTGAAFLNLAAALAILPLALRRTRPAAAAGAEGADPGPVPAASGGPTLGAGSSPRALVVLALSGAAALLAEIAWTRALALVLGSSVYAFALVLAAFLCGIGGGSLLYARKSPTGNPFEDLVHFELRAAMAAFLFAGLLVSAPLAFVKLPGFSLGSGLGMVVTAFLVAFALTAYATTSLGAAFPAGIQALLASHASPGSAAGRGYAANTIGAVLASLATALLLIPRIGLARTLALGVTLNILAALVAGRFRPRLVAGGIAGAVIAMAGLPAWWRSNQDSLLSGVYAYAYRYAPSVPDTSPGNGLTADLVPEPPHRPPPASSRPPGTVIGRPGLVFVADGAHANVAVYRDAEGDLSLRIDGKTDASTAMDGDMRTQLLLGHLPALLHSGPHPDALVIGLGSGVTASALLQYPETEIDAVEIEPRVIEVAADAGLFRPYNRAVVTNPRVRIHVADGRRFVANSRNRYDILTSEPSNLWMSGVTHLFTAEFFAEAARALRPGGVLCQWMHLYQVSLSDVQTVLRGLEASFPHSALFLDGPDLLVVASLSSLPRPSELELPPAAASDLARVGIEGSADLERLYVGDERALSRFAGTGRFHTDDAPVLEYTAPLSLARDRSRLIASTLRAAAAAVRRAEPSPAERAEPSR